MKIKTFRLSVHPILLAVLACNLLLFGQTPEQTPDDSSASHDEAIASTLREVFSEVESMNQIIVEVRHGVVHLRGETANWEAREQAAEIAQQIEGVLYVQNQIEASREIESRLSPTLARTQELLEELWSLVPLLLLGLIILLLFWGVGSLVSKWERPYRRISDKVFIRARLQQLVKTAILLVGVLVVLELLGLTTLIGTILGAAGIAGIILGFAFKDIVENYLAGILLSFRHPFSQNDHIRVGEFEGKVIRLTSRETVLMTLDGNHIRIPNATVFNSVVTNFTINPRRQFQFTAGIAPLEDLARVRTIGVSTLSSVEGVLASPPPVVLVEEIGDSSISLKFFGWVDQRNSDFVKVRSEAIRHLKEVFDQAGIEMPEPAYLVRLIGDGRGTLGGTPLEEVDEIREGAQAPDVSVDQHLDNQIEEDRAKSDEGNLLD